MPDMNMIENYSDNLYVGYSIFMTNTFCVYLTFYFARIDFLFVVIARVQYV